AEDDAASVDATVPDDAVVLAVDGSLGLETTSHGPVPILTKAEKRDRERDASGDAVHRQVARDLELCSGLRLDPRALERDGRKLRHVEEVGAAQVLVAVRIARVDAFRLDRELDG